MLGRAVTPAPPGVVGAPVNDRSVLLVLRQPSCQPRQSVASGATARSSGSGGRPRLGLGGGRRSSQIYELEQEGAYTSTSTSGDTAPAPVDDAGTSLLDDGWGIAVTVPGPSAAGKQDQKQLAKRQSKKRSKILGDTVAAAAAAAGASAGVEEAVSEGTGPSSSGGSRGTPFVEVGSEAGVMGLTLLQQRLLEVGRAEHDADTKARVAAAAAERRERQMRERQVRVKKDWVDPDLLDEDDEDGQELSDADMMRLMREEQQQGEAGAAGRRGSGSGGAVQYFELNLNDDGSAEVVDFDNDGRVVRRRAPGAQPGADGASAAAAGRNANDDDDDPLAFLSDPSPRPAAAAASAAAPSTSAAASRASRQPSRSSSRTAVPAYGDDDEDDDVIDDGLPGSNPIADEEIEWGLDEIPGASGAARPSLLRELGVIKPSKKEREQMRQQQIEEQRRLMGVQGAGGKKGGKEGQQGKGGQQPVLLDDEQVEMRGMGVAWGGSGGASGVDMEAQEALLRRMFKPHKVKQLMAHQLAAEEELALLKKKTSGKHTLEAKVHSKMRIIAGSAAGRTLASSQGSMTRPMMEKVRQAIFNMIQSQAGSSGGLPPGTRWLDLFAGTGSVGLEALSRGCAEAHFIELDPWVCKKVLSRNIATCGFQRQSVVHTMKAEDFVRRSIEVPRFAGGPFDFLSVCPPYLVVSYPELMGLLDRSPLLHAGSIVFVEYPKQLEHQVPDTLGPLVTVRDRKYGRTWIRVYAGAAAGGGDGAEASGGESGEGQEDDELLL